MTRLQPRNQTPPAMMMNLEPISSYPKRITIELTSSCNLSCTMCPRHYISESGKSMDPALFEKILNEIEGESIEAVVPFFRGEPLMHPKLLDMLRQLKEKTSAKLQMATNALLLTPAISAALIDLNIDFISFSLDAFHKVTYEKIRVGGDFHLAVDNVKNFLKLKSDRPACKTEVQVSATETSANKEELPHFIEYWKPRVNRVRIYARHSKHGKFGRLDNGLSGYSDKERYACRKPFTDFVIYHDGHVALCNHDWQRAPENELGSVRHMSIETIWHGAAYTNIRQKHLSHGWDTLIPCNHCDHWLNVEEDMSPIGQVIK